MGMSSASIRAGQAFVEVLADDSKARRVLRRFQAHLQSWSTTANNLGRAMLLPAVGIGLGLRNAIKTFSDFESEMQRVKARLEETDTGFDQLRKRALEMGKSTAFSAKEIASAMAELAQAGNKSNQIMDRVAHVVDFAAAAEISLADAAIFASTALRTFNLQSSQMGHMLDVIVKGANISETSVSEMADAFSYAAPSFKQVGASVQDLSAALVLLAHEGQRGDRAGTALRGIFTALLDPSERGSEVLRSLTGDVIDAKGEFIGLEEVIRRMTVSLQGVGGGKKLQALSKIFDNRQVTAIQTLVSAGPKAFAEARNQVDKSLGETARMARIQLDKLAGDWQRLTGTFDAFKISVIGAVVEPLRGMVNILRVAISAADEWITANPGMTRLVLALGAAFMIAAPALIAFSVGLKLAAFAFSPILAGMTALRIVIAAGVLPVLRLMSVALGKLLIGSLVSLGAGIATLITSLTTGIMSLALGPIGILGIAILGIAAYIVYASGVWSAGVKNMGTMWNHMTSDAKSTWDALSKAISAGRMDLAFKIITIGIELQWLNLVDFMMSTWEHLAFFVEEVFDNASTNIAVGFLRAIDSIKQGLEGITAIGTTVRQTFGWLKVLGGNAGNPLQGINPENPLRRQNAPNNPFRQGGPAGKAPGKIGEATAAENAAGSGQFSVPPEVHEGIAFAAKLQQRNSISSKRTDRDIVEQGMDQHFDNERRQRAGPHAQKMMEGQDKLEGFFQERVQIQEKTRQDHKANLERRAADREKLKDYDPVREMYGQMAGDEEANRGPGAKPGLQKIFLKGIGRRGRMQNVIKDSARAKESHEEKRADIRKANEEKRTQILKEREDRVTAAHERIGANVGHAAANRAAAADQVEAGGKKPEGEVLGGEAVAAEIADTPAKAAKEASTGADLMKAPTTIAEAISQRKERSVKFAAMRKDAAKSARQKIKDKKAAAHELLKKKLGVKGTAVAAEEDAALPAEAAGAAGDPEAISKDLTDATPADLVSADKETRDKAREQRKAFLKEGRKKQREDKLKELDSVRQEAAGLLSGDGSKVAGGRGTGGLSDVLGAGKASVQGTFSAAAAGGLGAGNTMSEIAKNTAEANGLLKKIADKEGPEFT